MLAALISRLPAWARHIILLLLACYAAAFIAAWILTMMVLSNAVGELARMHMRSISVTECAISMRGRTATWPRRLDGLCHIEDLETATKRGTAL